ncbi:hypothetical protein [Brachybacterium sp. Marseille-Q7125]|uniref:hypothetical protein n=1 Tax=Brachybacterium sp. Marseille-Q7125 TaxID=2932815 RepID=UPI001FF1D48D|nr:hypothetical protein [Brachybacterium sp. Marseille-Q7125]
MSREIRLSDLTRLAGLHVLPEAVRLASNVDYLMDNSSNFAEGIVSTAPPHVARISLSWPVTLHCTCGARYSDPLAASQHLCVHGAAVLVACLVADDDDPNQLLASLAAEAEARATLESTLVEYVELAVRRDAEGREPLHWIREDLDDVGVEILPEVLTGMLLERASGEQVGRFLNAEVEHYVGGDGDKLPSPINGYWMLQVLRLLTPRVTPLPVSAAPAILLAARKVRESAALREDAQEVPEEYYYLSFCCLLLGAASAGEPMCADAISEITALERRHGGPEDPLTMKLAARFSDLAGLPHLLAAERADEPADRPDGAQ